MLQCDVVMDLLYWLILGMNLIISCKNTVFIRDKSLVSDLKELRLIIACNEIAIVLVKLVRRNTFNASLVSVPKIGINDVYVQKLPLAEKKNEFIGLNLQSSHHPILFATDKLISCTAISSSWHKRPIFQLRLLPERHAHIIDPVEMKCVLNVDNIHT